MSFNRKNYEGCIFPWYAIDENDQIGEFVSGYAPIPKIVFSGERQYYLVKNYFENLPEFTMEKLSLIGTKEVVFSYNQLSELRKTARKGLFSFCEPDPSSKPNTENYELIAIPNKSLKLSDLPKELIPTLENIRFENLNFAELEDVKITDYFLCDYIFEIKKEESLFNKLRNLLSNK